MTAPPTNVLGVVQEARLKDYADGVVAGMEIAVRLFLGEPTHGSNPCPQPLPAEAEKWARDALAAMEGENS